MRRIFRNTVHRCRKESTSDLLSESVADLEDAPAFPCSRSDSACISRFLRLNSRMGMNVTCERKHFVAEALGAAQRPQAARSQMLGIRAH